MRGGGAIFVRASVEVVTLIFRNVCDAPSDMGGARRTSSSQGLPSYVVNSTFGARRHGNVAQAEAQQHRVSYTVTQHVQHNKAIGGREPMRRGPGGGAAVQLSTTANITLSLCGPGLPQHGQRGRGRIFYAAPISAARAHRDSKLGMNPRRLRDGLPGISPWTAAPRGHQLDVTR